MPNTPYPGLFALNVSGDLGAYTLYVNRNRKLVAYLRAPPKCPPTEAQLYQRARFTAAVLNWDLLTQSQKELWESCVDRLSIPMTGLNLWIALSFSQDQADLATIIHQSGIPLWMPPGV